MRYEEAPTPLTPCPIFHFYTDAWKRENGQRAHPVDPIVVTGDASPSSEIEPRAVPGKADPDLAWVAIKSAFVRRRVLAALVSAEVPALVLDGTGAWARGADICSASFESRATLRQVRRSVVAMMRVAQALTVPGFICVDVADLHVFLNHPERGARFVAECGTFPDEGLPEAFDAWMRRRVGVVDATVSVELSRTAHDVSGFFWHVCNRLQAHGAYDPPTMLPIFPMAKIRRCGSVRVTRLLALAPNSEICPAAIASLGGGAQSN